VDSPRRAAGAQSNDAEGQHAGPVSRLSRAPEGFRNVRGLLREVQVLGYTGCYSRLAAVLSAWRKPAKVKNPPPDVPATEAMMPCDPNSGSAISPIIAAALCLRPRRLLTVRQLAIVEVLKEASPDFVRMRALAIRFRGVLRGGSADKLEDWIRDAKSSGVYAMQRFAQMIQRDISAIRNAVVTPWEQWANRGPDQSAQNPETRNVWPCRCRIASRSHASDCSDTIAPTLCQTPIKGQATPALPPRRFLFAARPSLARCFFVRAMLRARPTKSESYLALGAEEWRGRDSLEGQLAPNVCR